MTEDVRSRLLRVLDRAVEYDFLTYGECLKVLDAFDAVETVGADCPPRMSTPSERPGGES